MNTEDYQNQPDLNLSDEIHLPTVHEGVLYVKKEPIYIVELFEDPRSYEQYVTVYAVEPKSNKAHPRKAFERVVERRGFKESTLLGQLAQKTFQPKPKEYEKDRPPLFMAELIEGKDTFTQKEGLGFYERGKDKLRNANGKPYIEHGELTGVFISLQSIRWRRSYHPLGEVLEEIKANQTLWGLE